MYSYVYLNKRNIKELLILNNNRKKFNLLNEDLWSYYKYLSFTKQLLLSRRVKLIKHLDHYVGYIWFSKYDSNSYIINSMYAIEEDMLSRYKLLLQGIKVNSTILYSCEKNNINYEILSKLGFKQKEGTYEMVARVSSLNKFEKSSEVFIEQFQKGKHEEIRCKIQNEVFKNDARVPITKDDIYYDQLQSYYFEKGSVFLKKDKEYIGYGQIIINDNIPTIVNVGLLEEYRYNGYGKILMSYLMEILKHHNFEEVTLRVSTTNYSALKLYNSLGFHITNESHLWEYKK